MTPEAYRDYMRDYMREYQRQHRDRKKYNRYMRELQARLALLARQIFCPKCATLFVRERYQRHPVCPTCKCAF